MIEGTVLYLTENDLSRKSAKVLFFKGDIFMKILNTSLVLYSDDNYKTYRVLKSRYYPLDRAPVSQELRLDRRPYRKKSITKYLEKVYGGKWKYDGISTWYCDDEKRHVSRCSHCYCDSPCDHPPVYYLYGSPCGTLRIYFEEG